MKKHYNLIMPMDENDTVKNQFGWLPLSVFKPERKEAWRELIGDDGDTTTRRSADTKYLPGLRFSEFHPHLAEIVIRYWTMPLDLIVDPFAGRATRGIVAGELGRRYVGYEIAPQTFEKDIEKGLDIINADGCAMQHTTDTSVDCVFTCPPYHRIEKYESAGSQLSDIKDYDEFLHKIHQCGINILRVLKPGKFLCWVCGDWRDGKAFRLFHVDCLRMFSDIGLIPHDIVVIHNNSPFAPLQAGKVAAKRYTSKTHEYLLVFRKGE
jgi:DNA modification methylase